MKYTKNPAAAVTNTQGIGNSNLLPAASGLSRAATRRAKLGTQAQRRRAKEAAARREALEKRVAMLEAWVESQTNPYGK